jgi:hypothetical protein
MYRSSRSANHVEPFAFVRLSARPPVRLCSTPPAY